MTGFRRINKEVSYAEKHGTAANSNKGWRGGINVSTGGFTIGGSYKDISSIESGINGTANSPEETGFDIGLQYDSGPWSVSATYLEAERPLASATQGDDEVSTVAIGANYVLGPGIDLQVNLVWSECSDEGTADANNNDGWAVIAGIIVTF